MDPMRPAFKHFDIDPSFFDFAFHCPKLLYRRRSRHDCRYLNTKGVYDVGERGLLCAIVYRAIADLSSKNLHVRLSAQAWFTRPFKRVTPLPSKAAGFSWQYVAEQLELNPNLVELLNLAE